MPDTIWSSVLLPEPFRPIRPRLSPRRSSKLTDSSTRRRSWARGRKKSSARSRTVSRRTLGIVKLFDTPLTSMTVGTLKILRHARGARAVDHQAGPKNYGSFDQQQRMSEKRRDPPVDEHTARKENHRGGRPRVEIGVHPFGEDRQRVNDRRDEEPRLRHDFPHLIQIAIAHEEDARGKREPRDNGEE